MEILWGNKRWCNWILYLLYVYINVQCVNIRSLSLSYIYIYVFVLICIDTHDIYTGYCGDNGHHFDPKVGNRFELHRKNWGFNQPQIYGPFIEHTMIYTCINYMYVCMYGWMDGCMYVWMDGWMYVLKKKQFQGTGNPDRKFRDVWTEPIGRAGSGLKFVIYWQTSRTQMHVTNTCSSCKIALLWLILIH